ncbi:MAG: phosphodiester glycosidase family protein [Lachnospiraceae bacterium]|nr:phosphodiester glycosidase family protein [Lachnospiraceae bacterium]
MTQPANPRSIPCIALIPAYRPDEKLLAAARGCLSEGLIPVVVDDGSGPAFDPIFTAVSAVAHVIRYEENRGKGFALKTGLAQIARIYASPYAVVTMDADGQHLPQDAADLARAACRERRVLFLGSRTMTSDAPLRSRIGNGFMRFLYRVISRTRVQDTQTGLRAFSDALVPWMLAVPGERYEYEMHVLLRAPREEIEIREKPIPTIYLEENRSSHYDTVRDSLRIGREILRFSASSFAGFLTDFALYSLLTLILGTAAGALLFANIAARLVSGTLNFALNRRLVFRSETGLAKSAVQYAGLAGLVLAANSALLLLLTGPLALAALPAKLLAELICFSLSYLGQRNVVFRRKETAAQETPGQGTAAPGAVFAAAGSDIRSAPAAEGAAEEPAPRYSHSDNTERGDSPMKQKKARRGMWTPAYLALLFGFTVYVLLDTFVIIRVYTPVTAQTQTAVSAEASAGSDSASAGSSALTESSGRNGTASQRTLTADSSGRTRRGRSSSSSGSASAEKQGTQDSAASPSEGASAAQAVATDTSYTDDNIRIELTTLRAYDTTIYAALVRADSTYLKTALAQNAYGKNVTAKTSVTAAQNGAILAVNGDYYGAQEKGYVIRGGVLYRSTPVSGREDLVIYADGSWEIITETQVSAQTLLERGAVNLLSFGPALIEDGQIAVTASDEVGKAMASNPRTAIARLADGSYLFVVSDGRTSESEGLSLYELAQVLRDLGAVTAYNLDGGGSSTMVLNGTVVNNPTTGGSSIKERSVSDIVYIGY